MHAALDTARKIIESANIEETANLYPTPDSIYSTWERHGYWVALTVRVDADEVSVLVTLPEIATSAPAALSALSLSLEVAWLAARIEAETGTREAAVSGTRRVATVDAKRAVERAA